MVILNSRRILLCLMRFAFFHFILLFGALASSSSGQSLALSDINPPIQGEYSVQEIFKIIEGQTDLFFSYHKNDIKQALIQNISLSTERNSNVYHVLLVVSKDANLRFKRIGNTVNVLRGSKTIAPIIEEQSRTIQGKVLDENGEGLPGATLLLQGTSTGTITDVDGSFSLEIPDGPQVLITSFVGYATQEINVSDKETSLVIRMILDLEALEEVVVVGYGTQKKESITGAVAKIDSKELMQTRTANVANNLAGRLPGLVINARGGQPGQENMEIFIRGKSTTGDASPLFVIDGVANRGTFERLNPDDIESISVLKDASAAIYGAQAANGVILVTTKRGTKGKPKFNYNNSLSYTQPARRQHLMNSVQYLTWIDEQNERNDRPQIYQNVIEDYENGENDPNVWGDTDWWEATTDQWSPQYQHSLSVSGGSENFKYYVSGQHLYQDAIYKGDAFGFSQNNLRSNIDITATSFLEIGLDLAGRFENSTGRKDQDATEDAIRGIYTMAPFESPYYENGLLRKTSKGNILPSINGLNGNANAKRQVFNNKLSAKLSLDNLIKGLSLEGFAAIDIINRTREEVQKPYDNYFLNADGVYDNLRDETGGVTLFQQFDEELSQTYHGRINYANNFGAHSINAFAAYEQNQLEGQYISASRINLVSAELPFLFTGSNANQNNDGKGLQSARVNYFGRLNYEYAGKYMLEFSIRRDASQNFPTNTRFGTFPGLSAGWRISEEQFWNSNFIEEFKLRGSWGLVGNDRVTNRNGEIAAFQYLQLYDIGEGAVFGSVPKLSTGVTPNTVPNPSITWETARKTNIGLDISMSQGLLDLTIDAFYEERSDILATRNASVPIYSGIQLPNENIGKTKNKGIEFSALHRKKLSKDFQYRIGGQFTYAKNEIVFIDESPFVPSHQRVEGSPIDYLLVYEADGLYQNQEEIDGSPHFPDAKPGDVRFVDVNDDGLINAEDRVLLPEGPTPRIVYGINLGVSWKGLELNAFFQGQDGASTIYRPWDINQDDWYFDNRWISEEETPNAESPAAWDMSSSTIQNVSTIWVKKNNFLRIKNVELAYTLPPEITDKLHISNVRLFVSAFNLGFIFDSVKLYDPESRSDTGWYYPQQRMFTTGLSVTF
jgi:TonB-linked SusC/RagA family outer membrane protein